MVSVVWAEPKFDRNLWILLNIYRRPWPTPPSGYRDESVCFMSFVLLFVFLFKEREREREREGERERGKQTQLNQLNIIKSISK